VENASRLAVDIIESCRLSSYTEKSTRYQVIDKDSVYVPEVGEYKEEYLNTINFLFEVYNEALEKLTEYFEETITEEDEKKKKFMVRAEVIDRARFLLPCSTLANVGITVNARELEHMLVKMFSYPLKEVQDIAEEVKEEGKKEVPTLIKYTNKNKYIVNCSKDFEKEYSGKVSDIEYSTRLVEYDPEAEERLIAAILYRFGGMSYKEAKEKSNDKEKIMDIALGKLGKFDKPLRELEYVNYTFDLLMDFGAYYDFKRHRMCTITPQKVSTEYGYTMPEEFEKIGMKKRFEDAMEKSHQTYLKLKEKYPYEAGYISTNAHKRRVLAQMNLRELYHYIKLRGSQMTHFTVRKITLEMLEELKKVHPLLVKYLKTRDF